MKIAMAQMCMSTSMEENYKKTLDIIEEARDADILFFPEIQLTPFFPQYLEEDLQETLGINKEELSISLHNEKIKVFRDKCKKYNLWMSPNLYIKDNDKYYDMSLMIDSNGGLVGVSKMVHVYQANKFYEQDYYTPSEDGFKVYDTPFGKIGIVICFDRHLPESIRSCAKQGAELIIIPIANTLDESMEMFEWEIRVQAYQNNVFIAMCNRVGIEGSMNFSGESIVVDSEGNIIFKADGKEQLIIQDINLSEAKESRKRRPYISLIRPDSY